LGLFDYTAREAGDVSFKKGDRMLVLSDKYFKFIREYIFNQTGEKSENAGLKSFCKTYK